MPERAKKMPECESISFFNFKLKIKAFKFQHIHKCSCSLIGLTVYIGQPPPLMIHVTVRDFLHCVVSKFYIIKQPKIGTQQSTSFPHNWWVNNQRFKKGLKSTLWKPRGTTRWAKDRIFIKAVFGWGLGAGNMNMEFRMLEQVRRC